MFQRSPRGELTQSANSTAPKATFSFGVPAASSTAAPAAASSPFSFGNTSTSTAAPATTGGGLFGAQPQQQQQQQQAANPFAPKPAAATNPFGSFGSSTQAQPAAGSSTSLFGAQNNTTGGSMFGQQQNTQNQAGQTGQTGGLFGNTVSDCYFFCLLLWQPRALPLWNQWSAHRPSADNPSRQLNQHQHSASQLNTLPAYSDPPLLSHLLASLAPPLLPSPLSHQAAASFPPPPNLRSPLKLRVQAHLALASLLQSPPVVCLAARPRLPSRLLEQVDLGRLAVWASRRRRRGSSSSSSSREVEHLGSVLDRRTNSSSNSK